MKELIESRLVDEELAELPRAVIEGAYRSICAALLLRTYTEFATVRTLCKERINRKVAAQRWLFANRGLISFEEACEACNIKTQVFLDHVIEAADNPDSRPTNKVRLQPHRVVFGRQGYASEKSPQPDRDCNGMVPRDRAGDSPRGCRARGAASQRRSTVAPVRRKQNAATTG